VSRRAERAGAERVLRGWVEGNEDEDEDSFDVVVVGEREREDGEGIVRNASGCRLGYRIIGCRAWDS